MKDHLDVGILYDLLDGRLDPAADSAAQAHLLRCERCRELERECAGVVESLRWYGLESVEPPEGYWEGFWLRWSADEQTRTPRTLPLPVGRRRSWRLAPALAAAAALALVVGTWWSERPGAPESPVAVAPSVEAPAPSLRQAAQVSDWGPDYARFERMAIAVGGADPVSKGIVLASLAEAP